VSDKKRRPNVYWTKDNLVLIEGEGLAVRELTAEDVHITRPDIDHVLPGNMDRVLGAKSLTLLGHGHQGTVIRVEDGTVFLLRDDGSGATQVDTDCAPPRWAEFIGAFLVKPEWREHVLGCRTENFILNVARFGKSRASLLYWWDIAASLLTSVWALIKRYAGFAALIDAYRRVFGG
jgi:hypothetical protein